MQPSDSPADFTQLGLATPILQAVQSLGYEAPTPIQAQSIPHLLAGRDLLGQAQTGTGKTAAFALPLLCRIDSTQTNPQVLVLTPTRELALQVAEAFQVYARYLPGFHVVPIYGGQSYSLQIRQLQRGVQVIVGTPGRVMDHLRRTTLNSATIHTLVLDEADEMLNMGFIEDIEWIFEQLPQPCQVALFSATLPATIRQVASRHLTDPVEIRMGAHPEPLHTIMQQQCIVTRHHKLDVLTRVLELETFDAILIFVRTKNATEELAERLVAHGFAAEALNGDMSQALRERTVERLKNGRLDILVATDVAARGLDVERITHVVNYDIPNDPASYVHRIGRTGRAGRSGHALLLVEPRERYLLQAIERTIRQRIPALDPPSADRLSEHRIDRFTRLLRDTLAEQDLDFFYRVVTRIGQEQELGLLDIAAALTYLMQRERPLEVSEHIPPVRDAWPSRDKRRRDRHQSRTQGRRPLPAERPRDEGWAAGNGRHGHEHVPPQEPSHLRMGAKKRKNPPVSPNARREGGERAIQVPMLCYRIEVGRRDGVSPREIVGAIANEAGLEGRYIGRIAIHDDYSLLDLPEGMPREIQQHLRRVIVCGKRLELSHATSPKDKGQRTAQGRKKNRSGHSGGA